MPRRYNNLKKYLANNFSHIYRLADRNKKIIKFLIAGGTATIVDLSILFLLTDIFGFWYLISAAISYSTAFIVSFLLQKFWTFREASTDKMKKQFFYYFSMTVFTMILNLSFLFILVDFFEVYYVLAQLVIGIFLASGRFVINNFLIFKINKDEIGN